MRHDQVEAGSADPHRLGDPRRPAKVAPLDRLDPGASPLAVAGGDAPQLGNNQLHPALLLTLDRRELVPQGIDLLG